MRLFTTRTTQVVETPDPIIAITSYTVECAWCNAENGTSQGNGSHGICNYHSNLQYQQYQAARQNRRAGAQ